MRRFRRSENLRIAFIALFAMAVTGLAWGCGSSSAPTAPSSSSTPAPTPTPTPAPAPAPAPAPTPTPATAPAPAATFTGTWRGTANGGNCVADGAFESYCRQYPSYRETVTFVFRQTGSVVTGTYTTGSFDPVNIQGNVHDNHVNFDGSNSSAAVEHLIQRADLIMSGNTMTGTYFDKQVTRSSGSGTYTVTLSNTTRIAN